MTLPRSPRAIHNGPQKLRDMQITRLSALADSVVTQAVGKAGDRWPAVADALGERYVRLHGASLVAIGASVLALLCEWEQGR